MSCSAGPDTTGNLVLCLDANGSKSFDSSENRYKYSEALVNLGYVRTTGVHYASGGPYNNAFTTVTINDVSPYIWDSGNNVTIPAGTIVTCSVVVCNVSLSDNLIYVRYWSGAGRAFLNTTQIGFSFATKLTTVTAGTILRHGVVDEGNNWYRIWFTAQADQAGFSAVSINPTASIGSIFKFSALQLEYKSYLGNYTPTTNAAVLAKTTWNDISGTGDHFTISGPEYISTSPLHFSFSDNLVHQIYNSNMQCLTGLSNHTVDIWIRLDAVNVPQAIVSYAVTGSTNEYLLFYSTTGFDIWYKATTVSISVALTASVWYNVVNVISNTENTLYINSAVVSRQTKLGGNTGLVGGGYCILGQEQDAVGGGLDPAQELVGDIGSVRIYSHALSDSEVIHNFNASRAQYGL